MSTVASIVLARKMRLVSDESKVLGVLGVFSGSPDHEFEIRGRTSGHGHRARGPRFTLVPADHGIGARRYLVDPEPPFGVGEVEERMTEDEDERVHVRVDVTEDAHDARPIEADRFGPAHGI